MHYYPHESLSNRKSCSKRPFQWHLAERIWRTFGHRQSETSVMSGIGARMRKAMSYPFYGRAARRATALHVSTCRCRGVPKARVFLFFFSDNLNSEYWAPRQSFEYTVLSMTGHPAGSRKTGPRNYISRSKFRKSCWKFKFWIGAEVRVW